MDIVFTLEDLPKKINKSIFLAGPVSRDNSVESWREEAIKILKEKNFDGTVFLPEARNSDSFDFDHDERISWEDKCLNIADCILFWIPRDLEKLPGFTTNDEWGFWKDSGKVVLGCPEDAENVSYQKYYANEYKIPFSNNLNDTIQNAINKIGEGKDRTEGERFVPLYIWNTETFQQWYNSQKDAGNKLEWAKVLWSFRPGNKNFVFSWVLKVDIYIKSEDRIKSNEFVLGRTNISSVMLWYPIFDNKNILDSEVVIIKEFRSPANTKDGFVRELVSGSSSQSRDPLLVAKEEVEEETGFSIHPSRFIFHAERQLSATLSAHKAYLYSVKLNKNEINWFKEQKNKVHGNIFDSEMTYVEVVSIKDIIQNNLLDWSTLGKILLVVMENENRNSCE